MRHFTMFQQAVMASTAQAHGYLTDLPPSFNDTPAIWARVTYNNPSVAVLSGSFNRSAMDAPYKGETTDPQLKGT